MARALISLPRILSFDEPLGALDALTRIEMQRLIERVFIEQAFTAVLVTHDVAEALALADRIIVLDKGGIALDVDVRAIPALGAGDHIAVHDPDPDAVNTVELPDRVSPRRLGEVKVDDGHAIAMLPPLSWNMIRLRGDRTA